MESQCLLDLTQRHQGEKRMDGSFQEASRQLSRFVRGGCTAGDTRQARGSSVRARTRVRVSTRAGRLAIGHLSGPRR